MRQRKIDMEEIQEENKGLHRKLSALVTVMLVLATMLCLHVTIQVLSKGYVNIAGYSLFRVVTGSMEPEISVGSLLIAQEIPMESIQLNDRVCFRTREAQIFGEVVTHRVVNLFEGIDGALYLETKGDANLAADGYFVTKENLVGKVVWYTKENSMIATIFSFFNNKIGFLACIVFPCLMLAGLILQGCVNSIRGELKQMVEEMNQETVQQDPLLSMTPEEYDDMCARIRAELVEELKQGAVGEDQKDN